MTTPKKSAPAATETLSHDPLPTARVSVGPANRRVGAGGSRVNVLRRDSAARTLRVPHMAASYEDSLQVNNEDLQSMSPSELEHEVWHVARIAARDPQAFVWRGLSHISARQWADERIQACRAILQADGEVSRRPPGKKKSGHSWLR